MMARPLRIGVDIAIGSLRKVRPVVSKTWCAAKTYVAKTNARILVCNPVVSKLENVFAGATDFMESKIISARNQLLKKEIVELQQQIETTKKRIEEGTI
ncbi:unnamed protein product [Arctia plantaginis]|uniref:Uncharacterized protein n=1 Tax=Arctia plantaginis TaxID=874455 RepID=A0A8S0ZZJ0_ARCPL|nr:unnamed protein product [Arctia plantaginis]CAB3238673.1 unnamed protein product [Arctia plantaginis]